MHELTLASQQYFPTYHLDEKGRDVALKEYDLATSTLAAENRIFSISTTILVAVSSIIAATINNSFNFDNNDQIRYSIIVALSFIVLSVFIIWYFASIRRSIVLSERKIVILRRILGLSYGSVELVLPSNTLEGANEPYRLLMFHGWSSPKAIPLYIVCIVCISFIFLYGEDHINSLLPDFSEHINLIFVIFTWIFILCAFYRYILLDQYEDFIRILGKITSSIFGISLIENFEYATYRARLSAIEAKRVHVDLKKFRPILIHIEDRRFYKHRGVSIKAIIAAVYRYIVRRKKSGGSTITQQLVRTIYIRNYSPLFRRKIIEIILALSFELHFRKDDIIDMYISSVRYENDVIGITDAIKYFFPGRDLDSLQSNEVFFLIERVANINSKLLIQRIAEIFRSMVDESIFSINDAELLIDTYKEQINSGRISATDDDIDMLRIMISDTK